MTLIDGGVPRNLPGEESLGAVSDATPYRRLGTVPWGRRLPFVLKKMSMPVSLADSSSLVVELEQVSREIGFLERRLQLLDDQAARLRRLVNKPVSRQTSGVPQTPTMSVQLLGQFAVGHGERYITAWPSRKGRLLLAYLAFYSRRMVSKDVLMELLWPGSSLRRASNNLSIAVHQMRSILGSVISCDGRGIHVHQGLYGLDPSISIAVDVDEFRAAVTQGRLAAARSDAADAHESFGRAVALYKGEFLESDLYEEWTIGPRREMSDLYVEAVTWLASSAIASGDWRPAKDYCNRLIEADPANELGCRGLMRCYAALGSLGEALQVYEACTQHLTVELGVEPSGETQALYRRLFGR